jgi:hypothetical protein
MSESVAQTRCWTLKSPPLHHHRLRKNGGRTVSPNEFHGHYVGVVEHVDDKGNCDLLHSANYIKLGHYLGRTKDVKVAETKFPGLNDTSDSGRSVPAPTIPVNSVITISPALTSMADLLSMVIFRHQPF